MKRSIKILILSSILLLVAAALVYAQTTIVTEKAEPEMVSAQMTETSSKILSILNSDTTNLNKKVTYDKITDRKVYQVSNSKYSIKLDSNNNLIGIYSKNSSPVKTKSIITKDSAREIITSKYNELNLPSEYELVYLEKVDDEVWEADFQKNYNGIYNKYEAVKTFFIPENNEIVALTVFNEGNDSADISISQENAIQTATNSLNIDSSEIVSSTLTMEKANTFYDKNNADTSVHTVWKLQTSDNSMIYIDATENNVIGGDCINE